MQLLNYQQKTAKPIEQHESRGITMTRITGGVQDAHVALMYIEPGGVVGGHPALGDQLFIIVQGAGWVEAPAGQRTEVTAGQAAFWNAGEWHQSGSDTGMMVMLVEAKELHPVVYS